MDKPTNDEAQFVVETHSIDVIPDEARHGRPRDLFPMWFGGNIQITIVLNGALSIASGLSLGWAILATFIGLACGGLLMSFHSAQGPHLGLPQMIQSRAQFGLYGANIPLIIAVFMYLGFLATGIVLGAQALANVSSVPIEVGIPILGILMGVLAVLGYRAIHMFQRFLSIMGGLAFAALTCALFATSGDPAIAAPTFIGDNPGFLPGPFLLIIAVNAVLLLSYGPYVADYSRYLPKDSSVKATFWYTFSGAVIACMWLVVVGAILQNRYPSLGVVDQINYVGDLWAPGYGSVMMVVIVIGAVGVNSLNIYGAFMSSATIGTSFTDRNQPAGLRFRVSYILPVTAVGIFLAYLQKSSLLDAWQTLLGFLLYFLIPWTAINLVDYYLVRKGHYELDGFASRDGIYGRWNKAGMSAFVIGCLAQLPFVVSVFYTGPLARFVDGGDISWLVGTLVAGAAYYLLASRMSRDPRSSRGNGSALGLAAH
ncbi:cytosine permease [Mycolicibacterium neoaurum]|uniref:purine-cytosine permease family protein n=1 Tax=Mycolicibacterium neoaurum TaxID=1795 RepID=UPI002672F259|nr:cytosine permease [Mycolicibacterium neoaurum]MDO3399553.1 cytosine permease [Mycolicibacterium neoaurum]